MIAAAWIHAWCAEESCERYYLPIVLMGSPFAALATGGLARLLKRGAERLTLRPLFCRLAWFTPLLLVGMAGGAAAFNGPYARRSAEVELARWIRHQYGPQATLFGSPGITPVVAYYAQLNWTELTKEMDDAAVLDRIRRQKPDVILLLITRHRDVGAAQQLVRQLVTSGFSEIDRSKLPEGTDAALIVVVRKNV